MNPNIWMSAYMHNNLAVEQGGECCHPTQRCLVKRAGFTELQIGAQVGHETGLSICCVFSGYTKAWHMLYYTILRRAMKQQRIVCQIRLGLECERIGFYQF